MLAGAAESAGHTLRDTYTTGATLPDMHLYTHAHIRDLCYNY